MTRLSETMKSRITEVLNPGSFMVKYDDERGPAVTITCASSPEHWFVINSIAGGTFTTDECPGVRSDSSETFQRSDLESCLDAIRNWMERVKDSQADWIMDEFGGIADRNPSLPLGKTRN